MGASRTASVKMQYEPAAEAARPSLRVCAAFSHDQQVSRPCGLMYQNIVSRSARMIFLRRFDE